MKTHLIVISIVLGLFLFGCAESENDSYQASKSDITTTEDSPKEEEAFANSGDKLLDENEKGGKDAVLSNQKKQSLELTSKMNLEQTGKKFIKTSDVKFRVKDVQQATFKIEDLATKYDGFIINSHLRSNVYRTEITSISADSSLESKYYMVESNMIVRVPHDRLDSILRDFNKIVDFLDYRVIDAKDVTIDLLANELKAKRYEASSGRYTAAIDNKTTAKLGETTEAEDRLLDKQLAADQNKINNLTIEDQIAYSTIKIQIYQHEAVNRTMIENFKNIEAYRPGLFTRIGESLVEGWYFIEDFFVALAKLWGLLILGIAGYLFYKLYWKKASENNSKGNENK